MKNGPRMKLFEAPTRRMMPISARRAMIERRIVLLMNTKATKMSSTTRAAATMRMPLVSERELLNGLGPVLDRAGRRTRGVADLEELRARHDVVGDPLGHAGIGQLDDQRGRDGVAPVERRHGVGRVGRHHGLTVLGKRLFLALVGHRVHAVPSLDLGFQGARPLPGRHRQKETPES